MNNFYIIILCLCIVTTTPVYATLINPPSDLGDMVHSSEVVVYGTVVEHINGLAHLNKFQVLETIKGNFVKNDIFTLEEYSKKIGDGYTKIEGDIDFEIGKNYLVFLGTTDHNTYKLSFLALSSFEEGVINDKQVFAHNDALRQLILMNTEGLNLNSLKGAYEVSPLLHHLKEIATKFIPFNETTAALQVYGTITINNKIEETPKELDLSKSLCQDNVPCHCTTFYGGDPSTPAAGTFSQDACDFSTPGRFFNNTWDVCVYAIDNDSNGNLNDAGDIGGDPSTTTEIDDLINAITAVNALPGIDMTYQGIENCPGSCSPNGAASTAQACNTASGDINKLWVFFDDPCNEVVGTGVEPGCAGIVGLGSSFFTSSCFLDDVCGNTWVSLANPYLIMNENAACVGRYDYTRIMVRELLQAVGLGHIGGQSANPAMEINGTGCPAIDGTTPDETQCSAILNAVLCAADQPTDPDAIPGDMGFDGNTAYSISSLDSECTDWLYNQSTTSMCGITSVIVSNPQCVDGTLTFNVSFNFTNADEDGDGVVTFDVEIDGIYIISFELNSSNIGALNSGNINSGNLTLSIAENNNVTSGAVTIRNADLYACNGTDLSNLIPACLDCNAVTRLPIISVEDICAGNNVIINLGGCNYADYSYDLDVNETACTMENPMQTDVLFLPTWFIFKEDPSIDPNSLIGIEDNLSGGCQDVTIAASEFPNTSCDPIIYTVYALPSFTNYCADILVTPGTPPILFSLGDLLSLDVDGCPFFIPISFTVNPAPFTPPTVTNTDGSCNYQIELNCTTETAMTMLPSDPSPAGTVDITLTNSQGGCSRTFNNINYDACVPVELLDFSGEYENDITHLKWTTASEWNNDYFQVERSLDGVKFDAIGKVPGNGTSLAMNRYKFEDQTESKGTIYYRLKQVDFNETFEYSNIIAVNTDEHKLDILVYPSPASDVLNLISNEDIEQVKVIDFVGRKVSHEIYDNVRNIQFDVSALPAGTYLINVQAAQKISLKKFVKN